MSGGADLGPAGRWARPIVALSLAAALLAAPVLAQDTAGLVAPGTDTPEALATLVAEVCLFTSTEPRIDPDALAAAGLVEAAREEGTVSFASPDGLTLDLAARPGFAACELRIPQEGLEARETPGARDGLYAPLAGAMRAAMGMTYEIVSAETVPDGQVWELLVAPGLVTTLRLQEEGDALVVTSAIELGRVMDETADQ